MQHFGSDGDGADDGDNFNKFGADRQTYRQTDRQTNRQTDRQTDKHIEI